MNNPQLQEALHNLGLRLQQEPLNNNPADPIQPLYAGAVDEDSRGAFHNQSTADWDDAPDPHEIPYRRRPAVMQHTYRQARINVLDQILRGRINLARNGGGWNPDAWNEFLGELHGLDRNLAVRYHHELGRAAPEIAQDSRLPAAEENYWSEGEDEEERPQTPAGNNDSFAAGRVAMGLGLGLLMFGLDYGMDHYGTNN